MAKAPPPDLLDVDDAGKVLGVKGRQVRYLIASGALPAQKVGGGWVIKRADLANVPKVRKPGPKRRTPKS